ncbi:oxidoreductase [Devosia sp. Root685]|nr:oxidoreductase [Devosia sp. Root685]
MGAGWLKAVAQPDLAQRLSIVALVDANIEAAAALRASLGSPDLPIYADLDAALAGTPADMLFDVAVPMARKNIVTNALAAGCHVLTEKPMADTLENAEALLDISNRSGLVHAVTQNRRFKTSIRRIRKVLAKGMIGRVSALHCDFFIGAHFGGFRDEMEHVLLLDMAIHTFDAARYMSGRNATAVYCQETNPAGSWYRHGAVANAIFEFEDDITFTYRGSWAAEGANTSWEAGWRIVGSKGTLLWDGEDTVTAHVVDGDEGFFRPLREVAIPAWDDDRVTREHESVIADFLDAVETGRSPESAASDNIKSLAMVFGAIESARTRQRVTIEA